MGKGITPNKGQNSKGDMMPKTKEEVHQIISEIIDPYRFEAAWSPSIKEEIEQALSPLECRVFVKPTSPLNSKVEIFYKLPDDEPATFRHIEIGMELTDV